jgi:hypothetical protein
VTEVATGCPPAVGEYAEQAVDYVQRALGLELSYDSETLPLLDHYVRQVPDDQPAARALVVAAAGAYFGEVIRRAHGGSWVVGKEPSSWRLVLPAGLSFAPAGFVAAAMARADVDDYDTEFDAPARMMPFLEGALEQMGEVTEEVFYSLCGRYDTIEHLQDVLLARLSFESLRRGNERD